MSNLQKRLLKLFFIERLKVMGFSFLFFSGVVVIFSLIPRMETFVFEFEFEGSTLLTFSMIFSIFLKCIPQFQLSTMAGLTRTKIIMNELLLNSINVLVAVIIFLIASSLNINWTIGSVHIYFSVDARVWFKFYDRNTSHFPKLICKFYGSDNFLLCNEQICI